MGKRDNSLTLKPDNFSLNFSLAGPGFDFGHKTWLDGVVGSIASGALTEAALDTAVARVLRVKTRLGLLDQPYVRFNCVLSILST